MITGHVQTDDLANLTGAALAMVYVSLFEGFGIPIVESMQAGRPVITSNCSSMKEVAANAAILANPESVQEISHAMERILEPDQAKILIERGFQRASDFSWDRSAELMWEAIERTIAG